MKPDDYITYRMVTDDDEHREVHTGNTGKNPKGFKIFIILVVLLVACTLLGMCHDNKYLSNPYCDKPHCHNTRIPGGSYCSEHTCREPGCKLGVYYKDGEYCYNHRKNK